MVCEVVASDFASVLALRHLHGAAWGRCYMYVMRRLRPRPPLQLRLDPGILDAARCGVRQRGHLHHLAGRRDV